MSYYNVEHAVEAMLKTAFQTKLTTAELTHEIKTYWGDESGDDDRETKTILEINIAAAPNEPQGWQDPHRILAVDVEILTQTAEDPTRALIKSGYDAVRESVDEDTFSSSAISVVNSIVVDAGTGVQTEGRWNIVYLPLTVDICV